MSDRLRSADAEPESRTDRALLAIRAALERFRPEIDDDESLRRLEIDLRFKTRGNGAGSGAVRAVLVRRESGFDDA